MNKLLHTFVIMTLVLGGHQVSASLYEQPWIVPGAWSISDTVDHSGGRRAYDNFMLNSTASIAAITWWGGNVDAQPPYDNPVDLDVIHWEIGVWANDIDRPGQLLHGEIRPMADVSVEFIGLVTDPTLGALPSYQFHLALDKSFGLQAGTEYWLSVMALSPTTNPWFHWMSGQPGDGWSRSHNLFNGNMSWHFEDRAFFLHGVPVPPAVWLFCSALIAFMALRR